MAELRWVGSGFFGDAPWGRGDAAVDTGTLALLRSSE